MGLEPTASLVLSQSGLPLPTEPISAQGRSRTGIRAGLSRAALPVGLLRQVVPDGVEPSFPGCDPEVVPLDHGPMFCVESTHRELHPNLQRAELASSYWTMSPSNLASGSRGTRTHKRREAATCFQDRLLIRPDDFRSCRTKKLRELESNQRPPGSEPGATTSSSYPGIRSVQFGEIDSNYHNLVQSQAAYR